jgi:hypothetical protein
VIGPGGYLVLTETVFNPGAEGGFGLSGLGEDVYLFSGDGVDLTGWVHGFDFDASTAGVSFGRHVTGAAQEHFVRQTQLSLGGPNALPVVGPVVINEIMFHPPPTATGDNNTADEYIELSNITSQPVALFDTVTPTNTWRIRGGIDFEFPPNVTVPGGSQVLVVNFSPDDSAALNRFRSVYGLTPAVPVFGPYRGNLSNDGERINLSAALTVQTTPAHSLVDQVRYQPGRPWPSDSSASGNALQRIRPGDFGDEPANWLSALPTPGAPNLGLDIDSDADGLPDAWERSHLGTLTALPSADPDFDSATNLDELRAGTRPNDPASHLRLYLVALSGGSVQLEFYATAGRAYSIFGRIGCQRAMAKRHGPPGKLRQR